MPKEWQVYCRHCGARITVTPSEEGVMEVVCASCKAVMQVEYQRGPKFKLEVEGSDANDVQKVASALVEKTDMKIQHKRQRPSPWVSGSFYLTVFVVVIVALLAVARVLPIIALPIVLLGGILALSIIGAFQLRQDNQLSQKNFLELMALTFKYLPWLKKQDDKTAKSE